MKIVLTGFEPFGGEAVNPSWEAVKLVRVDGVELVRMQLPVVFGGAAEQVLAAIDEHAPDAVILVGQAGGRKGITVERVAINVDDARIADNVGAQPIDQPIAPDGPAAYFSTLPIKEMVKAMEESGVEASVSNSAGTYVCNNVLYQVLHHISQHKLPVRATFVHLPFLGGQQAVAHTGAPFMALDGMAQALQAAIKILE